MGSKNTDGEDQPLSALFITDTDMEANIPSNMVTVINTRTDTKGHLTDTRGLVIVKSPTKKSQRRTKIGRNRKKRPMKMAIGRTTLTNIGKNKKLPRSKSPFANGTKSF